MIGLAPARAGHLDGDGPIILNTSIRLQNKSNHSGQVIAITRLRRLAATTQQSIAFVVDAREK